MFKTLNHFLIQPRLTIKLKVSPRHAMSSENRPKSPRPPESSLRRRLNHENELSLKIIASLTLPGSLGT
jgi:hypothetical protein